MFYKGKPIYHSSYISIICVLFVFFNISKSRSEGTKQLQPAATDNGFIQIFDNNTLTRPFATYNSPVDNRLNIHINTAGEKVFFGFNQPDNDVYFQIKDPLGNIVMGPTKIPNAGAGFISTHAQAVAGPNVVNAAGYNPLSFTSTMTGDYYVEFNPVSPTVVTPSKRVFTYFDFTVTSPANVPATGRLWSKSWDFQCNSGNNPFVADLFIYTNDGVVTGVDFNGIKPFGFVVSSNSSGCTNTGNFAVDRQSRAGNVNYPEYKIFLNDPDHTAYPTGSIGNITAPTTVTGCAPGPYCINVTTDAPGSGEVLIELNGVAGYQAGTRDVLISSTIVPGANCVQWNGKDGLGAVLAPGTQVPINVTYLFGLTNLPIYDAEFNPNGYKVYSVRPAAPVPLMRWDDALVGGSTNLNGCVGNTGCHSWPQVGAGFGDVKTLNTWWYINTATDNTLLIVPNLTLNTSVVGAQCSGTIPGSGTVIPTSGTPPYTYSWNTSPVQTTATATNLAPGNYTVAVTDACGTTKTANITVPVTTAPIVNAGPDVKICPGNPIVQLNGSVIAAPSGKWTGGGGIFTPDDVTLNAKYTPSAAEISSHSVTLTLTSVGSVCPAVTDQMVITITDPLVASISEPSTVCFGQKVSLSAIVSGGTAPYTYLWNIDSTTQVITNQPGGNYSVKVTDATSKACSVTVAKSVPQNPKLKVTASSNNITSCNTTTSISAIANGGTANYTYAWSNGATGTFTNVSSGTYIVTTTDAVGCKAKDTVVVNAVNNTLSASVNQPGIVCNGGSATLTVTASGGFGSYSYLWSNGSTGLSIVAGAGTHCVKVTDGGGCVTNSCATITEGTVLNVSITNPPAICNGAQATITPVITGGITPYKYLWSTGQTASSVSLSAGNYSLTVTDGNNCQASANVTVTQTASLTASFVKSNVDCKGGNNGSANISVAGGTAPYSYLWTPGGANTSTATALAAGTYQIKVTDAIGCTNTFNTTITEPIAVAASISSSSNVSCNGGSNGSATVLASGGTPAYTYFWSPSGGTAATANGLAAGTYIATVEDSKGCRTSASITITEPQPLAINTALTNVSCFGGTNGSITATVSGGTPVYTYLWSPSGGTTSTASNLSTGNYSIQVTDSKGCSSTNNVVLTAPAKLTAQMTDSTIVSCFGGNDGTATVLAAGGTSPYTYLWSTGETTFKATKLTAGTRSVTVTDSKGCTVLKNVAISQNPKLSVDALPDAVISCESTIVISANPSGGDGNYSYLWSDGVTTGTSFTATTGKYEVYLTDGKGCKAKDTVSVVALNSTLGVEINAPVYICRNATTTITTTIIPGVSPYNYLWDSGETGATLLAGSGFHCVTVTDNQGCRNTACVNMQEVPELVVQLANDTVCFNGNGTLTPVVTGGHPPLSYSWDSGETTQSITKTTGTYTVTVLDSVGCSANTSGDVVQINDLNISFNAEHVKCLNGADGSVTVHLTGGKAPYTYLWSHNNSTEQTLYNLTSGIYTVTATDAMGCSKQGTVSVDQPSSTLSVSINKTNISCFGEATGEAAAAATGGVAPYTYFWWQTGNVTNSMTNLSAGVYNVIATDAVGCEAFDSVRISQPLAALSTVSANVDIKCFGESNGSGYVSVSGGTIPYSYAWSNGKTDSSLTNLSPGKYNVTVTDAKNCIVKDTIEVAQPAALTMVKNKTDILCNGGNTGVASVVVSGGITPYKYAWSTIVNTTASAVGLLAGNYVITVKDSNSCVLVDSIKINEPGPISVSILKTNVLCFGGSSGKLKAVVTGGTSPYSYLWTGGTTADTLSGVPIGVYKVSVSDANNCESVSASATLTQPTQLKLLVTDITSVSCHGGNNGSAIVKASGGLPGYTYSWSPEGGTGVKGVNLHAGNYIVTATDTNLCNTNVGVIVVEPDSLKLDASVLKNVNCFGGNDGSAMVSITGGTTPYITAWSPQGGDATTAGSLTAGAYTVSVTDAKSCVTTASVNIIQPDSLHGIISGIQVSCNGVGDGKASILMSGGVQPYKYLWSNGGTNFSTGNLPGGIVSVKVSDNNNCIYNKSVSITDPAVLSISATTKNSSCYRTKNGSALVNVNGGTAPFTYTWSSIIDTDSLVTALDTGQYSIIVKDAMGCQDAYNFTITEPSAFINRKVNVSCFGDNTGSAAIKVKNGVNPYVFMWSNGVADSTVSGLTEGKYIVTATDAKGCILKDSIVVTQPTQLKDSLSQKNVSCFGGNNGSASVDVKGGVAPYKLLWKPTSATTSLINNLVIGTYAVTITDSNNCALKDSVNITSPEALDLVFLSQNLTCNGAANGSVKATTIGGVKPFSYLWTFNNLTTDLISGLNAGTYVVTVTDSNNCSFKDSAIVTQPDSLKASIINTKHVSCAGGNDASAVALVSGGTAGYSYLWTPSGGTTLVGNNFTAGEYFVHITDKNGCTYTDSVTITQPDSLKLKVKNISDAGCFGSADGKATVSITGGTPKYNTLWSNGATDTTVINFTKGTFTVKVTDALGCFKKDSVVINQPDSISAILSGTPVSCNGSKDGTVSAVVSGGVNPIKFLWSNSDVTATADSLSGGITTVKITDKNGCSINKQFNVSEPLSLLAVLNKIDISCNGSKDGKANIASVTGGTLPYQYAWSNLADIDTAVSSLDTGKYMVTITDSRNCKFTKNFEILQPAKLAATLTKTDVKCYNGNDGKASANVSGGTIPYSFMWSPFGGANSVANNLAKGKYFVEVTDAHLCKTSDTVSVNHPDSLIIADIKDTLICIGQQINLTASAKGGSGVYTYAWDNGLGTGATKSVNPIDTTTYIVSVTDTNNCSSAPQSVTVFVNPPLSNSASIPDTIICVGKEVKFEVAPSGGNGQYSYSWDHGLQPVKGPHTVAPSTSTVYHVTITDGCGTPAVKDSVMITVVPLPVAVITPEPGFGCVPLKVEFKTKNVVGGPGLKYSWTVKGKVISTEANPVYTFDTAGVFTVNLTVSNSYCSEPASGSVPVDAWAKPNADFELVSKNIEAIGVPINFMDKSSSDVTKWFWEFGDGMGANTQNPVHGYDDGGSYPVRLTVENNKGCSDTAIKIITIRREFAFYVENTFTPNGDKHNDTFSGKGIGINKYHLDVFDRWGNHFYSSDDIKKPWDGTIGNEVALNDVYVYLITVWDYMDQKHEYSGHVNLVK